MRRRPTSPVARSVVIDTGSRAAVVAIPPLADSAVEGIGTVVLTLLPAAGYALAADTQAIAKNHFSAIIIRFIGL